MTNSDDTFNRAQQAWEREDEEPTKCEDCGQCRCVCSLLDGWEDE